MIQKVQISSRSWVKKSDDSDANEHQAQISQVCKALWRESYKCACLQTSASSRCASCWYLDKLEIANRQIAHSVAVCMQHVITFQVQVYIRL